MIILALSRKALTTSRKPLFISITTAVTSFRFQDALESLAADISPELVYRQDFRQQPWRCLGLLFKTPRDPADRRPRLPGNIHHTLARMQAIHNGNGYATCKTLLFPGETTKLCEAFAIAGALISPSTA